MSEAHHLNETLRRFRDQHPAAEGWKVFELRQYDKLGFMHLPELLDARSAVPVLKRDLARGLSRRQWTRDDYAGLQESDWVGELQLTWEGEPIHLRSVYVVSRSGYSTAVFAAVKALAALEGLSREIGRCLRGKEERDNIIRVINGRNVSRPELGWDDLCLPSGMAGDIKASAEAFFKSEDAYRRFGLSYRRGFLFSGPPGCGKTLTAKVIAAANRGVACVAYTPKDGLEAQSLENAFENAECFAPSILILEDLDKFGRSIPVSMVLNLLDGLATPKGILTIATTNEPERLDPALLLRPSRFDRVWTFALPEREQRLSFLKKRLDGLMPAGVVEEAAELSEGFSMAYVQEIIASAVAYAVGEGRALAAADLLRGVENLRRQIKGAQAIAPRVGQKRESLGFLAARGMS